jgi:peptidoglycan/xylan/chitin deacetylase (PgdA/CDA1 family)
MEIKKVHITFDYELFFGSSTGTVQKCMIEPTEKLIALAKKLDVKFVFFVDAGFISKLAHQKNIPECKVDYELIAGQIKTLHSLGHEIALHVHPHWEDCKYENGSWKMNTARYKLLNFSEVEVDGIVSSYHKALIDITGVSCRTYRAGGWCVQPFSLVKQALMKNKITVDSSVYKNGYHQFSAQSYDFRSAPDKGEWNFSLNECVEDKAGQFKEVAITPDRISPLFYISLYLKMKMNPLYYKPVGDGSWLKDKKKIYRQFYTSTNHFACCDGYFASRLKNILFRVQKENKNTMVVLGHPKSLAECSFDYLEDFIRFAKSENYLVTTIS